MRIRYTGLDLTTRTFLVAVLAFGLTTVTASTSYAGVLPPPPTPTPSATPTQTPPNPPPTPTTTAIPTPTATPTATPPIQFCHLFCTLDKKCSVGGSAPRDSCIAEVGDEVTYSYHVQAGNWVWEVEDDKLGVIGQSSGGTLTRTTTLTSTTTNYAWMKGVGVQNPAPYPGDDCICYPLDESDSVTVTMSNPTPTPTPTATPLPTPTPILCSGLWPETQIITTAKGQSPTNNAKVTHAITGHIIDPGSLSQTAHRIQVCEGTRVTALVSDTTGSPTNTASGSLMCTAGACWGNVDVTEKYQSISADGRDKDSITFIPK